MGMKKSAYAFNPFRVPAVKVGTVRQDVLPSKPTVGVAFNGNTVKLGRH